MKSAKMKTSCGVIIINQQFEILLGHATSQKWWDLPKGGIHADESPVDCAIRECYEETNLKFTPAQLTDLGLRDYTKNKKLHLFYLIVNSSDFDVNTLMCHTHFTNKQKAVLPEMDAYKWVHHGELESHCGESMLVTLNIALIDVISRELEKSTKLLRQS